MSSTKLLGLLTIDPALRREFFETPDAVIDRYRTSLSWEEAELLRLVARDRLAPDVRQSLDKTNELLMALDCPRKPCPWPRYYPSGEAPDPAKPSR